MTPQSIAEQILDLSNSGGRILIGIAGPPGAGKSTLSVELSQLLNQRGLPTRVVPMDGFHLDNDTLSGMNLLERKGAPETFDAEGFVDLVERIAANRDTVSVPGFDRSTDAVVPDIDVVEPHHKAIVLEGNYLLLQSAPWNRISGLLDLSILINPGQEELERRLIQRWLDQGFSLDKAVRKARSNDIPNAFTVIENSSKADIVITSDC